MNNNFNKKILENVEMRIAMSNFELKKEDTSMNKKSVLQMAATFLIILTLTTGVVFAQNITKFIGSLFGPNVSDGVKNASEHGYIVETNMDYIESNGTEIKVDYVLMDDFNLSIMLNIKLQEFDGNDKVNKFIIPNLLITDESENIIVANFENSERYEQFCKDRGIEIAYRNIAYSDGSKNESITDKSGTTYSYSYNTHSEGFPKSKKLKISFDKIILQSESNVQTIKGNWNINVNLDEEMYNRESIIYTAKSYNDDKTILTKAILSQTALKIELTTSTDKIDYNALHSYNGVSVLKMIAIQKEYVVNSNGERFETSSTSDGESGYGLSPDNVITYHQTFNLTKYNATNELTLHLPTNDGKELIIELVRKEH